MRSFQRWLCAVWVLVAAAPLLAGEHADMVRRFLGTDPTERRKAADELLDLGKEAADVQADLEKCLVSEDLYVRAQAARMITKISGSHEKTLPVLLEILQKRSSFQNPLPFGARGIAITGLGEIGPPAKEAAPLILAEQLFAFEKTHNGDVAPAEAHKAFTRILPEDGLPLLVESLGWEVRPGRWGSQKTDLDYSALGSQFYHYKDEGITQLIANLKHKSPTVRRNAADVLAGIGKKATAATEGLTAAMKDHVNMVRVRAANALWQVNGKPDEVLPTLIGNLGDPETYAYVSRTLHDVGKPAIPALIEAFSHSSAEIRAGAADALRFVYQDYAASVPGLIKLLRDPNRKVADSAAQALEYVGPAGAAAIEELTAGVRERRINLRLAAAALARHKELAKQAVPALHEALRTEAPSFDFSQVANAIMQIDPAEEKALVATLVKRLDDPASRSEIVNALRACSEQVGPAIPTLAALLNDSEKGDVNARLHLEIIRLFGGLKQGATAAAPELAKFAADEGRLSYHRVAAIRTLGGMGTAARSTEATLKKLETNSQENVARAAKFALEKMKTAENPVKP